MKLSIIIPAYNEEKLIGRCIQSILDADIPVDYEIIVINNNSTDKTKQVAKKFKKVKVIDEYKKGVTKARQTGYKISKGEIMCFFDADSIITKNWFKTALNMYEKDKKIVGVSGPYEYEDVSWFENLIYRDCMVFIFNLPFSKGFLLGGNFSIRKSVLKKMGGFNTKMEFYGEDTNTTKRVVKYGKIKFSKKLTIKSSARRLKGQGKIKTLIIYFSNYFSEMFINKPITKDYKDIR
ncbi:MAG: glycosyltransferase family 2 protein [Candidatus Nanoarchaeia archaeon]|nr:glycosyltransferase family 2 protein [Candidatus Nanoarchaeia archaeon]MDD5588045.1 glycosyltransferase family 2 protein [Candidatus Nanoarchaeia archaeon]